MPVQEADEDFFGTLGVPLLAGRTFSAEIERDRTHAYILNETAVRALGWAVQDAVGRRFGRARSAERRTREIGIRKVLGASVASIVLLLSKTFLKLVLVANLIAWPIAYYLTYLYLQNFAYRTPLSAWPFVLSGLLALLVALLVALLTVGTHAFTAARINPVETLRSE